MKVRYLALALLTGFASVEAAAQSALPRKDIPAIAKAANGAIVTIITANNDKPIAQGTGFLVSADGVIMTNYHVIATGNVAIVKFPNDTAFSVDGVLAADKVRDLAIIKIHGKTFRTLALGDSDDIQVGEEVVAIGNPLGLELTVSNGILSGVRTDKEAGGKFFQITAPITHGSSGGPLFNMMGQVVGITTLGIEGAGNLNFAIPVNDAKLLLSNQSAQLLNLPNEEAEKETSAFVRYHVMGYNPNTRIVVVRYGNKLFTLTVLSAKICHPKPVGEFDSEKDCVKSSSVAGTLVGQDILSAAESGSMGDKFEGYFLMEWASSGSFSLNELKITGGPYKGDFRNEAWSIEKVEEVNQ